MKSTQKSENKVKLYLIEQDGRMYVEDIGGQYYLPDNTRPLPFKIINEIEIEFNDYNLVICLPSHEINTEMWMYKDDIVKDLKSSTMVKQAITYSFCRPATNVCLINKKGLILILNNKEGLIKNQWNLPGGFLQFGDTQKQAAVRELREELDIEIDENDLILFHVDTQLFHRTYLPYVSSVSFYCLYDENKYKIRKNENEIGEIKWVRPLEFINKQIYNSNLLAYRTVEELIKKGVEWKQY